MKNEVHEVFLKKIWTHKQKNKTIALVPSQFGANSSFFILHSSFFILKEPTSKNPPSLSESYS